MRPISRYLACTPARRRRVARSGKAPAFTLLELIVVIVVLAILALLAIPTFTGVIRKSKDATAEATLSALGRDVAALAALNGGTITSAEIQTAVSELPSSAAAPGRFAAGTAYSLTSGTSTAPGQIAYDIASGGSKVGLAEVAPSGDVIYALASSSGVQTWVGCSAATGAEALSGPSGASACATTSGSSSVASGTGPIVVTSPPSGTSGTYSGAPITYTVPSGVSYVEVTAAGAQGSGSASNGSPGGKGGTVAATIPVQAGQVLYAYLGASAGTVSGAPGSFGEGVDGGGGATSVFLTNGTVPGAPSSPSSVGNLVLVGGAGGGGNYWEYNPAAGGAGGTPAGNGGGGGGGAGATATGPGGDGAFGTGGTPGVNTEGGAAGGGGGFYGGGGGQADFSSAAGGGGSSWAEASAQDVTYTNGARSGNGTVSFQAVGAAAPTTPRATYDASTGAVALSWTASPSSSVTGYAIYRNGAKLATVAGASTASYSDTSAPQGTSITYGVAATTSSLSSLPATTEVATESYPQTVLAGNPTMYLPLSDTSGTTAVDASGNGHSGTYTGAVALGGPGPLLSDPAISAPTFGGGWVTLPSGSLDPTTLTVEAWFKTTATGGVIIGYQNAAAGQSASDHVPVLYVGSDGKLRAELWNGGVSPITSVNTVNTGTWQFAALVASASGQRLYLNGHLVGTLSGAINPLDMSYAQIGWGDLAGGWPAAGASAFSGQIGQAALFPSALGASTISNQYGAA